MAGPFFAAVKAEEGIPGGGAGYSPKPRPCDGARVDASERAVESQVDGARHTSADMALEAVETRAEQRLTTGSKKPAARAAGGWSGEEGAPPMGRSTGAGQRSKRVVKMNWRGSMIR